MKKSLIIMPLAMAMMLSGCALFNRDNKSDNSGSNSQQQSSGSQSGADIKAGDYTFSKSTSGLDGDKEASTTFTVGDAVQFVFATGLLCSNNFDEFGLKSNQTMTMKSLSSSLKIKKIVLDNYKYYNDCPLYAGESASGDGTVGVAAGADADNHNKVTWASLDGAAYTYKNTYTSNSWTFSVTVTLG